MVELKDATLTLGGRRLFENLSMMALNGQLTCITGAHATGKTAVVRVLLGFLQLDEGLVSVDGELMTPLSAPAFRRMMAYIPQKVEVELKPFIPETTGQETVWSPWGNNRYRLTPIDEHLDIPPIASKPIIIADDPAPELLSTLTSLAGGGHTVVVATEREEYLNLSDKIITLGNNVTVLS